MKLWIHAKEDVRVSGASSSEGDSQSYRGILVRDFRSNADSISEFESKMDTLLDAFDIIQAESSVEFVPRFFNIGANGNVSFHFYYTDDLFTNDLCSIGIFNVDYDPKLYKDRKATVELGSYEGLFGTVWITEDDSESIADAFLDAKANKDNYARDLARKRASRQMANADKLSQLMAQDVETDYIDVPIDVEVLRDRPEELIDDIPSDDEIVSMLNDSIDIEDTNRFIKSIVVKFGKSGVTICVRPKIRTAQLLIQWSGKTSQTQFLGACRSLSRRSVRYFDELKARVRS